ncbi:MAG: glycoside hydrolase family 2, partial [Planctomycetota bacterium]|nr:glycoside hydrolase family 2 [Planctomycetota bacterium]
HGKQALRPAGCSYTACSGIWQTVWLEPVAATAIDGLKMTPDLDAGVLHLTVTGRLLVDPLKIEASALDGAAKVATASGTAGIEISTAVRKNKVDFYHCESSVFSADLDIPIAGAKPWSPDSPFLYDLVVELKDPAGKTVDVVKSYFGMRKIAIGKDEKGNTRALLNGKVLIMPGALDQGYWPDGIYTAPTDAALRYDIEAARKLGLNAVRKHVKTEPERWYYWADKLGLLVLQDMPSGNEGDPKTDRPRSPEASMQCETEMRLLIRQFGNHPSIICWIMFNEGWGQHDTLRFARWAKELDPTRLIDEASGFPWHGGGDVVDCHGGVPPKDPKRIGITSEDGGWGVAAIGHCWSEKSWTYSTYDPETGVAVPGLLEGGKTRKLPPLDDNSRLWMTKRVRGLFRGLMANKDATGQSGDFYCQIVDVEDECNGLLSYDRAVFKVDPEAVRAACRGEEMSGKISTILPSAEAAPVAWRYTTEKPAADWFAPAFDASSWKSGPAGFGAGINGVRTPWTTSDIWLRQEFTLAEKPAAPLLRMFHDEDVEVYLNGVPACRESGFLTSYDTFDISPAAAATLKPGKNVIAVHCRQTSGGQFIDLGIVDRK